MHRKLAILVVLPRLALAQGSIDGIVRATNREPIPGALVEALGTTRRATSRADGSFHLALPAAVYRLRARAIGYAPATADSVVVSDGRQTDLTLTLERVAVPLAAVIVTPGSVALATEPLTRRATLTRADIETRPQIGDDFLRAISRLPGLSSNDYSARFAIRGSPTDELLVRLDGVELYEPFHLRDYDGSLSIVDASSVTSAQLTFDGFTAEYGDHLAGVLDMRTLPATPGSLLGASLSGIRASSAGSFASNRGTWSATGRRGYLDLLLRIIGEGDHISPSYDDLLGHVTYAVSPGQEVGLHFLRAGDVLHARGAGQLSLDSRYRTDYGWATWRARPAARIAMETIASFSALTSSRRGFGLPGDSTANVRDDRGFHAAALRQEWSGELTDRQLVKFGGEVKRVAATYDYARTRTLFTQTAGGLVRRIDSARYAPRPRGVSSGGFIAYRARPSDALTLELGTRMDAQSYTGETTVSPRVSLAYDATPRLTIRLGGGRYSQSQGAQQLDITDGDTTLHNAARAQHRTVGVDYQIDPRTSFVVDAYDRRDTHRRPRYASVASFLDRFPELGSDRVRIDAPAGRSRGMEIMARRAAGGVLSWSMAYAWAHAVDRTDSVDVPRALDQTHTIRLELGAAPSESWRLGASWELHTGWPYTTQRFRVDTLPNGDVRVTRTFPRIGDARLPPYHRLDLRAAYRRDVGRGELTTFVDVFNAYDRHNVRGFEYTVNVTRTALIVTRERKALLPILPSVGATWRF